MIRQPENFPGTLKKVLRQLGLHQEELAHELGVNFATVNDRENGKTVPFRFARAKFEAFCERMKAQGKLL